MDEIEQVHAAKRRRTLIGIAAAAAVILLLFVIFGGGSGPKEIDTETALSRAPALALTEAELALTETILEFEGFRDALTYDLTTETALFSWEETEAHIRSVIPDGAEVTQIGVRGAVVLIEYVQPHQTILLEYVDADRNGRIDTIRKALSPIIDGTTTGCYTLEQGLDTGKTVCTYLKY